MKLEETAKQIFGERAAYYTTSKAHADPQALARIVELADPKSDWTALDIATGTGHTALALAPHVASVIGIDLTPQMLAEAEKLKTERGIVNVEFREGDVHSLPFADASFDLVASRRAPHHFSDIKKALGEIRRVLRPNGRLVIDDRSVPEDDFVDQCMNELDWFHDNSHVRQYRPSEWKRMLEEAGFAVEAIEPYTRHRPISSLTAGVNDEFKQKIFSRIRNLTEEEKLKLNLTEQDGEYYSDHWYLFLSAQRRSSV